MKKYSNMTDIEKYALISYVSWNIILKLFEGKFALLLFETVKLDS